MLKRKLSIAVLVVACLSLVGCGTMTRQFGGTTNVTLKPNEQVVNVEWDHDDNLWVLTKPADNNFVPQDYELKEYSNYGVISGKVVVHETK